VQRTNATCLHLSLLAPKRPIVPLPAAFSGDPLPQLMQPFLYLCRRADSSPKTGFTSFPHILLVSFIAHFLTLEDPSSWYQVYIPSVPQIFDHASCPARTFSLGIHPPNPDRRTFCAAFFPATHCSNRHFRLPDPLGRSGVLYSGPLSCSPLSVGCGKDEAASISSCGRFFV